MVKKNIEKEQRLFLAYLDGTLDYDEKKAFEKKLMRSSNQLNFLTQVKKSKALMEGSKLQEVPEALLDKALNAYQIAKANHQGNLGIIAISLVNRSLKVLENTFSPTPPQQATLAYRDSQHDAEQLIFRQKGIQLSITVLPDTHIILDIEFQSPSDVKDHVSLYRMNREGRRMIASLQPRANRIQFQDLPPDEYLITVADRELYFNYLSQR